MKHNGSDAFKFVTCETKWRRQAEGLIITVTEAVETTRLEVNIYKAWLKAKINTKQDMNALVTAISRHIIS